MATTDIAACCKELDPCGAVCLLNNVLVDLAVGKFVQSYKVGDESYSFAKPSITDVERLLKYFEGKCNIANGRKSRRRAKVCFVFDDNRCAGCRLPTSNCGCR